MTRVPDLLLERLVLGELDEAQAATVRERLASEPDGPERIETSWKSSGVQMRNMESAVDTTPADLLRKTWTS